ncbi:UDP-N-acetylglucosamine 2-epimerase (non-hydrolyzing) [Pseudohaliea sp.]|uniref:non-hydrolyzing UDP-N-acetylglucosamine 2-epimerase n=1 Tax=Pseudohaliea sp. TaxID=2740289 RepID=UPI0032EF1A40
MTRTSASAHILCVVGARPNFMKIAPIMRALAAAHGLTASLVHTGQHYDAAMKHAFFEQLHIPEPDVDLEVGSGSHAEQTAQIMLRFEPVLDERRPDAVLVVGDVNSTVACALVAVKKGIPVIHVESGLRSGDRSMPEEINRILTDQLSNLLFTTEAAAADNLAREGISYDKVHFAGNVMIDTLFYNLAGAKPAAATLGSAGQAGWAAHYGLLTLHRPANVDDPATLKRLLETLVEISRETPLAFPVHPRTRARIEAAGLAGLLETGRFALLPPQGYLEMLGLMRYAALVLTDSGGIQEETTALGVPCVTLRDSTERPITVSEGTNTVVGSDREAILATVAAIRAGEGKAGRQPALWDGRAAERIVATIAEWCGVARAA